MAVAASAWLEIAGQQMTMARRTETVVWVYLWALDVAEETGFYPSLDELREALSRR